MTIRKTWAITGTFLLCAASAPLYAQQTTQPAGTQQQATTANRAGMDLKAWNQDELRNGISANRLIGMDVRGGNNNSIGEVQNVIVDRQGKVAAILIDSQGFMNIGDTRFRIPWNEVTFGPNMDHVNVKMTEQQAERWSEKRARVQATQGGEFRLSELRDDPATLRDGTRHGQVQDFILSRDGNVKAVILDRDFGPGGLVAYPFQSVTFDTQRNTVGLGYDRNQVADIGPFDYGRFGIAEPTANVAAANRGMNRGGDVRSRGATGATGGAGAGAGGMNQERPARQFRG